MAPSASTQQILLSPAELSYLHTSLSLHPPIRPDGRSATDFRPLHAETELLPGTYGSARICFADGTEAVVGVKAEVEKSVPSYVGHGEGGGGDEEKGRNEWVEIGVEIPGMRDDDSMPVFLAAMLSESLLADGAFTARLWINSRFHWKLYLDILLLSQPLSYPLPLLSLTTHLALLSTRLPKLKSEQDEDPLFDDDWDASVHLYPAGSAKPSVTLLVMAVKDNIIFDPSKEELSVAEVVLAVSIASDSASAASGGMEVDSGAGRQLTLLAVRTIDPPSRLTHPGVPNSLNTATGGTAAASLEQENSKREGLHEEGVWQPPRGGAKRKLIAGMIAKVLEKGGVGEEVLDGLDAVELG
ncbi:Exosome complex component [Lachnellula hyalina]|uniref:Ribosomal RNA-processing protein 42 n=1 Tax=Lachnellula hyalina TaxID=1316788 RepID=A0A8H8U2X5_9HELO|nr:Exosome complex component [Lachnellula hyalina]TVY29726.1 Exosome complex component [Lachnellula hyalina]